MLGRRSRRVDGPDAKPLEVVIAGGGVGALECALGLHRLARERVKLTLVAPGTQFSYQPMAVLEPFVRRSPRELPLARFAAEVNATLEQDTVVSVDCERSVVRTGSQRELPYDALVIAVGARTADALPSAVTVNIPGVYDSLRDLIEEIERGSLGTIAFVAPKPTWPLPVYELALLVREQARQRELDLALTIITAERKPLAVFGDAVSAELAASLADAGIQTVLGAEVESLSGSLIVHPGGQRLSFDRVVALPRLQGPAIGGLPADPDGFLPVGANGQLIGVERVYVAGDATDFPVKYGGIAAQQADAAAAAIAAVAGAPVEPAPFDGVVHGFLLRGRELPRLHFSARIEAGVAHDSQASEEPTTSPEAKIAAQYLGPYLDELWASGARWLSGPWAGGDDLPTGGGRP
jgi:sulfide:quinone oxidoreductase